MRYVVVLKVSMISLLLSIPEAQTLDTAIEVISQPKKAVRINSGGVPPPWNYKLPQTFDKTKNSGFTFGISREECRKRVIESHFIADTVVPGPGSYTPTQRAIGTEGSKWSLRPRTISPMDSETRIKKVIPGPGTYQPKWDMNKDGIYYISKFVNSQARSFTPKQLGRFASNENESPGPGAYEVKTMMNKDGNHFLSKFPSSKCFPFSKSERKFYPSLKDGSKKDLEIPGPGSYRAPSAFGLYELPLERSNSVRRVKRQVSVPNPGKRTVSTMNNNLL